MNKEIIYSFGLSTFVCAFSLLAHVQDTEVYDYTHQYSHEKKDYDSQPHHDGEQFPDFNQWMSVQMDKEDQAKAAINQVSGIAGQWVDPLTAGINAASLVELKSPDRDSDQR